MNKLLINYLICLICFNDFCYANNKHIVDANIRYSNIISSLRCLVCQNQSITESNADFAKDIRNKVVQLLQHGYSNSKIINYFIKRYGEYIYYRPAIDYRTYILWFAPFIILLLGLLLLLKRIK